MKIVFNFKTAILLCFILSLFACERMDQMNLDDNFIEEQKVLEKVDEETFVALEQAAEVANLFFNELTENNIQARTDITKRNSNYSVETLSENGRPLIYIINYLDGGFVIMGTTKNYYPILAYSDKNSFNSRVEISGLSDWIKETKKAIKTSDILDDTTKVKMQKLWKHFETSNILSCQETKHKQSRSAYSDAEIACWNRCDELQMKYGGEGWRFEPLSQTEQIFTEAGFPGMYKDLCFSADFNNSPINASVVGWKDGSKKEQVGPLLSTKWHQHSPFNDLCGGKPAGCAAVAVAQVMKYYKQPQSFSWNGYSFTWSNIPDVPNSNSDQSALIRLVGNVLDMHYSSSGSWATPNNVKDGLRFLGYNVTKNDHDFRKVEKELFAERPVIMVGNDDNIPLPSPLNYIGNSHYWVCEGVHRRTTNQMLYFTEWQPNGNGVFVTGWNTIDVPGLLGGITYLYFYMNWGWGGQNDGWFAFNNVNSGSGDFEHSRQDFYITKP